MSWPCACAAGRVARRQADEVGARVEHQGLGRSALDIKSWKRVPGQPNGKLSSFNPWSFNKDGTLHFDGVGLQENLLLSPGPKTNGIFHAEWRFKRAPAKGAASGGLLVRTSLKGDVWHQALAGNKAGGFFIGQTTNDGKPAKIPNNKTAGPTGVLAAGEWNVYEVTFKDKTLSLFANGYNAADWPLLRRSQRLHWRQRRRRAD